VGWRGWEYRDCVATRKGERVKPDKRFLLEKHPTNPLTKNESVIRVRLHPKSSRNQITVGDDDVFKIKVTSPPVDGKANKALVELLAEKLRIPKSHIEITSGKRSRMKSVRIYGLLPKDLAALLSEG
jgi:uncharacterized protein (TIGR00251 family)